MSIRKEDLASINKIDRLCDGSYGKRVYISGGITGVDGYEEDFKQAESFLYNLDYEVFNPARFNSTLPEIEYDEYMQIDYVLLDMCDAIFLLDGWENSKGAKLELQRALSRGMTIMTQPRHYSLNPKGTNYTINTVDGDEITFFE